LPPLCYSSNTTLCILSETSQNIGQIFGVNFVIALGFKKDRNYEPLVRQISTMCPKLSIPWMKERERLLPLHYKQVEQSIPAKRTGKSKKGKKEMGIKIRKAKVIACKIVPKISTNTAVVESKKL